MHKPLLAAAALAVLVLGAGCARHVHHHHHASQPAPRSVYGLDAEHHDRTIVVVRERPRPGVRCWRHARHWHCRR